MSDIPKKYKILCVDEENNPVIQGNVIEHIATSCTTVATQEDALRRLEREPFHAIIFACDTENEKSCAFFETLTEKYPETASIVFLPDYDFLKVQMLVEAGVDDIIAHPFNIDVLPLRIAFAVEKHSKTRKLATVREELEHKLDTRNREYETISQELDQNNIDTIKTFIGLLETRYRYLGGHCKRVATFSRAIGDRLDLNDRVRNEIEIGALLHDIGKIAMPDVLLQKSRDYFAVSQLSKKELTVLQKHPIIGQEAVDMIEMLKHVGAYIRHHHERYDGTGYPDGLKGRFIPLGARVITIADAYDRIVMAAEQRLRKNASELFLKYLDKQGGVIFDPEVVQHMVLLIKEMESKEYARERHIDVGELEPGMVLSRDVYTSNGVLLISQFERLTPKDIARIHMFHKSNMIMGIVYIYGSVHKRPAKKSEKKTTETPLPGTVESLTFEKVCQAIDNTKELGTLPGVYTAVVGKLNDPKSTRDDIATILRQDQVIVAKLLKIVNSSLFGFSRDIMTIEEAIPLLGLNEIRNIVMSLSVMKRFNDDTAGLSFDLPLFWKHSIGCAVISEIIAKRIGAKSEEVYFTAGLLHDIGRLIMDQLFPGYYPAVLRLVTDESMFLRQAERMIYGHSHQYIGEYMLTRWNLPKVLCDAVRNHHSPMDNSTDSLLVSAVHTADIIAHMLDIGKSGENTVPRLDSYAERKLGITLSDIELLVPEIDSSVREAEGLLSLAE